MTRFNYAQLDDGSWGVKANGDLDQATKYAGTTVDVFKRDGTMKRVTLGSMITSANGGRSAWYAIANVNATTRRARVTPRLTPDEIDARLEAAERDLEIADDIAAHDAFRAYEATMRRMFPLPGEAREQLESTKEA